MEGSVMATEGSPARAGYVGFTIQKPCPGQVYLDCTGKFRDVGTGGVSNAHVHRMIDLQKGVPKDWNSTPVMIAPARYDGETGMTEPTGYGHMCVEVPNRSLGEPIFA